MPIKPIDLQAMYTQITQLGKHEALARSTGLVHAELQREIVSKKNEQNAAEVHLPEEDIENSGDVKVDENANNSPEGETRNAKKEKEKEETESKVLDIADDPDIGKNIDVLG